MTMSTESTIISLRDVSMSHDRRTVLADVNLDIDRGDFIAITGPNGGGKTTLLRIILKLLKPTTGSVTYLADGRPTRYLNIGYLPQKNMIDSRFPITVGEVIRLGLTPRRLRDRQAADRLVSAMTDTVGLTGRENATIGELSGGQMQRALLGRAIISEPELLVLDEPLSYVDKHFEQRIYSIIANLAPRTTIILVSHEMSTIAAMANRHLIVDGNIDICHSRNHFMHYDCCDHDHSHDHSDKP